MNVSRGSPAARERGFKGGITGKSKRKATVTGYVFGSEPLVEVRLIADQHGNGEAIDLTFPQTRQMVRLLLHAIEDAADLARHDGRPSANASDRESPAGARRHVRSSAEAEARQPRGHRGSIPSPPQHVLR